MIEMKLPDEDFQFLLEIVGMHHAVQFMKKDQKEINKSEKLIRKFHQQLLVLKRMDIFNKVFQ